MELLSTVIEHLVKGEIMQMKPSASGRSALDYYLRKNFYKTASLMGHSCLAAAVLGEGLFVFYYPFEGFYYCFLISLMGFITASLLA